MRSRRSECMREGQWWPVAFGPSIPDIQSDWAETVVRSLDRAGSCLRGWANGMAQNAQRYPSQSSEATTAIADRLAPDDFSEAVPSKSIEHIRKVPVTLEIIRRCRTCASSSIVGNAWLICPLEQQLHTQPSLIQFWPPPPPPVATQPATTKGAGLHPLAVALQSVPTGHGLPRQSVTVTSPQVWLAQQGAGATCPSAVHAIRAIDPM